MTIQTTKGILRKLAKAVAMAGLATVPSSLLANPIPLGGGAVLQIHNAAGTQLGLNSACIAFNVAFGCLPGDYQIAVSGQDPVVFSVGSTFHDTIKDLSPFLGVLPLIDFQNVDSPLPGGLVHFDLISIVIPAIPAGNNCTTFAIGAICSPGGGSSLLLTQLSANEIGFQFSTTEEAYSDFSGVNYNNATPYNGTFSFQISGVLPDLQSLPDTIPNFLAFLKSDQTIRVDAWSATETPATAQSSTPEPLSVLLLGSGLLAMAGLIRGRHRA